ncbi:MAG: TIGR02996 domain-containing protein [Myxococcota bacterium]|nr:TIGR02996 domain-containing protein [Myxococcota bacterium]
MLANPDDDHARRVYADLLSAHGDPRGDFIAVQCEIAARGNRTEREDPKTKPLWERFRELHSKHSAKWTKPLKALGKHTKWELHRGFVRALSPASEEESTTPGALADILASEPVIDLELGEEPRLLAKLLDVAGIERVRRLGVHGWSPSSGGSFVGKVVGAATRVTGVRELRLGVKLGDPGVRALLASRALGSVTHLAIGGPGTSAKVAEELASSPLGQQLEILEWNREEITPALAKAFIAMPKLKMFVGSDGWVDGTRDLLAERFGDGFVIEDEPGDEYILDGVAGVSLRKPWKR